MPQFSKPMNILTKKPLLLLLVAAAGILVLALFSSIRVGAHDVEIDANLSVTPNIISFESVFPGEVFYEPLVVALSDGFLGDPRLDDVEYRILQQVKPREESDREYCQTNPTDYSKCFPSLCPYLSKTPDGAPVNDTGVPAFHDPTAPSSIALGRLAKSENDPVDNWVIDLHTPCFIGECDQSNSVPPEYQLDPNLHGETFACDLVVEVLSISKNCPACEKNPDGSDATVIVDQNVTVDFNPAIPVCVGDPDLCAYFTYNNSGPNAGTWKAVFDVGGKKVLVKNGATVTAAQVGAGNNKYSPGIEIKTSCHIEVENGGKVIVSSLNRQAGDIVVGADGNITINGEVTNKVTGTNGLPGEIKIESACGDIVEGQSGLIQDLGVDPGGNDIYIFSRQFRTIFFH